MREEPKCCCFWVSADGCTPTPLEAGLPSTAKFSHGEISARFSMHPAVAALARNRRWRVYPELERMSLLEGIVSERKGRFDIHGCAQKYDIFVPQPPPDALAYVPADGDKPAVAVAIAKEITGKTQVKISPGGEFVASANLEGKTIRLRTPTIYRQATEQLPEKVEVADFHAVFKVGGSADSKVRVWQYRRFRNAVFSYEGGGRFLFRGWASVFDEYV